MKKQILIEYSSKLDSFIVKGKSGTGCITSMIEHACNYAIKEKYTLIVFGKFEFTTQEIKEKYPNCDIVPFDHITESDSDVRFKALLMYINKPVLILYTLHGIGNKLSVLYHLSHAIHKMSNELELTVKLMGYHQLPAY